MSKETIHFKDSRFARALFANDEDNLEVISRSLKIKLVSRGDFIKIIGEQDGIKKARRLFEELSRIHDSGKVIERGDIIYALTDLTNVASHTPQGTLSSHAIQVSRHRGLISPKSKNQADYIEAIRKYDVVISIGPAGTGKTYLAMAMAVSWLLEEKVQRIILTRPAVEAGESLGFLPGDLQEKLNPYLRPLYDALYNMLEVEKIQRFIERGIIEVAPLAYMRGRTLNDSFIVLDEAQNSTIEQMKMFLTRLGFNSKMVITGDITQVDLPAHKLSGLIHAVKILDGVRGVKVMKFAEKDVVRHELVKKIIRAYENDKSSRFAEPGKVEKRSATKSNRRAVSESSISEDISAT